MDNIEILTLDPATLTWLKSEVNAWRHYSWLFAEPFLHTDVANSRYFVDYLHALNNTDKELEEALKIDDKAEYQNMPSFIKSLEIVNNTNGFFTWIIIELPQRLLEVE